MQSNLIIPRFGHTITIDLIMDLSRNEDGYNYVISVTDCFTKKVIIIFWKGYLGYIEMGNNIN